MFGRGDGYSLVLSLPRAAADYCQQATVELLDNSVIGLNSFTKRVTVRNKYHVTVGVFTDGDVCKRFVKGILKQKDEIRALISTLQGNFEVRGIGCLASTGTVHDPSEAQVVYLSVRSSVTQMLREKVQAILKSEGLSEGFHFTDPHITLFTKHGKGDIHSVAKPLTHELGEYGIQGFVFGLSSLSLERVGKRSTTIWRVGGDEGVPSSTIKERVDEVLNHRREPKINFGLLFKHFGKESALVIKNAVEKNIPLKSLGYNSTQEEEIRAMIGLSGPAKLPLVSYYEQIDMAVLKVDNEHLVLCSPQYLMSKHGEQAANSGFVGSYFHFFHKPKNVYALLFSSISPKDLRGGKVEISREMDTYIGFDALCTITETDLERVQIQELNGAKRQIIDTTEAIPPTRRVNVILVPFNPQYGRGVEKLFFAQYGISFESFSVYAVLTIYPGMFAPPMDDVGFWNSHALLRRVR